MINAKETSIWNKSLAQYLLTNKQTNLIWSKKEIDKELASNSNVKIMLFSSSK